MNRNVLGLGLAFWTLAMASCGSDSRASAPEPIVTLRQRVLTPERYAELEREWKAYTVKHPRDPMGWAQLARAMSYARRPCSEFLPAARKAVELGPNHALALATLGRYHWDVWCDGEPRSPRKAIEMLERAIQLDPTLDEARFTLWTMKLAIGERAAADAQLRHLLDGGRFPEPLLDFAYNLLAGLEPNAILLTNGDNDTYPVIALQVVRKIRPDVSVLNVSMLNLDSYRRDWRNQGVPIPILEPEPPIGGGPKALSGLISNLAKSGWPRPLYAACTLDQPQNSLPNPLSLEGVVYRMLPSGDAQSQIDTSKVARNLTSVYRLESATSPSLDWNDWSAVSQLMMNYCAPNLQLAHARVRAGNVQGASEAMEAALQFAAFHNPKMGRELLLGWKGFDPTSAALARWEEKLGTPSR